MYGATTPLEAAIPSSPITGACAPDTRDDECRRLHERFTGRARERAALDARELGDLVYAEELEIWKLYGYATMFGYLEGELGYSPHTAGERLRVAHCLRDLPVITERLAAGQLHFSAVRELTRVATSETEDAWLAAAAGKNLRQIEQLVSGHREGDLPDDDRDPELEMRDVTIKMPPSTYALYRQACRYLDAQTGDRLEPHQAIDTMCRAVLTPSDAASSKPPAQIAFTVCRECARATQDGAGVDVDVDQATLARALCDAVIVGDLQATSPQRQTATVPANVRKRVLARDHHRCTVPGCRNARYVEVHHIKHQACGGTHDMWNLTTLCTAHHTVHHSGQLRIRGSAPSLVFERIAIGSADRDSSTWEIYPLQSTE